jgi:S-DNA-T family DNA segregation ATPase FtsK/SpoIIIE
MATQKPIPTPSESPADWQDTVFRRLLGFQRFMRDSVVIFIVAFAAMTFFAILGWTDGALITPWSDLLREWMGSGAVLVVAGLTLLGFGLFRRNAAGELDFPWGRVVAFEVAIFSIMILFSVINGVSLERAEAGLDGGLIGWGLAEVMGVAVGPVFRFLLLLGTLMFSLLVASGQLARLVRMITRGLDGEPVEAVGTPAPAVSEVQPAEPTSGITTVPAANSPQKKSTASPLDRFRRGRDGSKLPPEYRKKFKLPEDEKLDHSPPPREAGLPGMDVLVSGRSTKPNERHINLTAGLIEKTLADFGIPVKVTGFQVGPTITQFALEPGYIERPGQEGKLVQQKVRVNQISSLRKDLALALSADRLRIQAPVPGRAFVGIEVPNADMSVVRLRPILESEVFHKVNSRLGLGLGLDVSGHPVVADLEKMPHLLIAGTTGSGKSVCIASITASLVMNNSPEDLRLVMIDPKKVELVRFNGLPHLMGKVETQLDRILGVLRWVVAEMDRRYRLLEKHRSRNLNTFNAKMRKRKKPPEEPLPHIVVLVDELADLMMSAADQTEPALVRLAQLARATGIHLVVATQRPSTDVVTGLIKANFPARLAFAVASSIDSRVVLDSIGAEALLGNGDLLFLPPEAPAPIRAQGALITDPEIGKIIQFWKDLYETQKDPPPWDELMAQEAILADRDDLVNRAVELVKVTQRASASMLQRRLRVGYPRAARLIDELEEMGIIGPAQGAGKERDVLVMPEPDE